MPAPHQVLVAAGKELGAEVTLEGFVRYQVGELGADGSS